MWWVGYGNALCDDDGKLELDEKVGYGEKIDCFSIVIRYVITKEW